MPSNTVRGTATDLPRARRSVLQTVFDPILTGLDAPANATRSLAAFARTGNTRFLSNVPKSLIPGGGSFTVSGKDVTGSDNEWLNLGIILALDPLMFVGGVGTLNKPAKLLNRMRGLNATRRTQAAGRAAAIARKDTKLAAVLTTKETETRELMQVLAKEFRALLQVERVGPKRSILKLSVIGDVGDAKSIKHIMNKFPIGLMPDMRKIKLQETLAKTNIELSIKSGELATARSAKIGVRNATRNVGEVEKKIIAIQGRITALPTKGITIFNKEQAKFLQATKRKFGNRGPEVQELIDLEKTTRAKDLAVVGKKTEELMRNVDNLAKGDALVSSQLAKRVILAGETRRFDPKLRVSGEILGPQPETIQEATMALSKRASEKVTKLKKAGAKELKKIKGSPEDPLGAPKEELERALLLKIGEKVESVKISEYLRTRHLNEIKKIWAPNGLDADELMLVEKFFGDSDDLIKLEQSSRIDITRLKSDTLDYVKRVISPEARALRKRDLNTYNLMLNEARVKLGSANARKLFKEEGIESINQYLRDHHKIKFDFFDMNPVNIWRDRHIDHIRAINKAQTAMTMVEMYAKPNIQGMKATTFLKKLGLNSDGIDKSLHIPTRFVDELTQMDGYLKESIFNDSNMLKFIDVIDKNFTAWFRVGLTTPFPGFHFRNAVSNMVLNALGGVKNPKYYIEARRLQGLMAKGEKLSPADAKMVDALVEFGIPRLGRESAEFASIHGGITEKAFEKIRPLRFMRDVGAAVENNARIAHYLSKKADGLTNLEAMRSVNKYLFDYSDLTQFEKKIMRPTFLFYTWMRKNVPLQIGVALKNPRVIETYNKLAGITEEDVPDYLKAASTFPIPGTNILLGDPGSPFADLRMTNIDDAMDPTILGRLGRVLSKGASRLNPILRVGFEIASGREAFSQKVITDNFGEYVLNNLPISRGLRIAQKTIDTKTDLGMRILYLMTGAHTFTSDPKKAEAQKLEKRLIESGKLKRFSTVGRRAGVDPNDPELIAGQERLRELRK